MKGYAVCATPRSGSTYVCGLLKATGQLGRPSEVFGTAVDRNPPDPVEQEAQFAAIQTDGATPNGVYALKIFPLHFDAVKGTAWATRLPNLRFVHLQRRDALGQAISWARALRTGQWQPGEAPRPAVYDADLITVTLVSVFRFNTRWQFYLASNGIEALSVYYEDVMADPAAFVGAVARLLDVPAPPAIDFAAVGGETQRDEVSEEWRARYLAERRDLAAFH